MRFAKRIPLLPLLLVALAVCLTGCYTLLKHPDISDAYQYDGDEETIILANCGDCHAPPIYYRAPYRYRHQDDDSRTFQSRPIDPSVPERRPDGIGGTVAPGTILTDQPKDVKTRDEGTGSREKPAEPVKKASPEPKTPVRREASEEKAKASEPEKKTDEKKKERS